MDDVLGQTIKINQPDLNKRMADAYEAMNQSMLGGLYGDFVPPKQPIKWLRLKTYQQRAQDAWLVLTGKAELYDGY